MQLISARVRFTMQLIPTKEDAMRAATLLSPLAAAPRGAFAAPRRRLEIRPEELIGAVEISEEEILDDLLYPADRSAPRRPLDSSVPSQRSR
jgi:hypothetical protein